MKRVFLIAFAAVVILTFQACKDSGNGPENKNGELTDLGFLPAEVTITADFQPMVYFNGYLLTGTSDGIWRCNITTGEWSRGGLEGRSITALFVHPEINNKIYAGVHSDYSATTKSLFISDDGGTIWHEATTPVFNTLDNYYEDYLCFAVRPGQPQHIYANLLGGSMIAVSTDGGESWNRMNYKEESYFAYPCNITFMPDNADVIIQGSESPLDCAWLGQYEINESDPVILENFTKLVDIDTWSNRRPNELLTYSYTGDNIYVGQEGALSKVNGTSVKFIFKHEGSHKSIPSDEDLYYTYVKGIWVDPDNTDHIIFGGMLNNDTQPMQLYETYNEGITISRFTDKCGMENPCLLKIVPAPDLPALLFEDQNTGKVKIMLMTFTD